MAPPPAHARRRRRPCRAGRAPPRAGPPRSQPRCRRCPGRPRSTAPGVASTVTVRSSSSTVPPDQPGSAGSGSAGPRPGQLGPGPAGRHVEVADPLQGIGEAPRAGRIGSQRDHLAGSRRSRTTTSFTRLSTSGRARPAGSGRDEADPVRREAGREHRHRHDHPASQAGHLGVDVHHLAVGEDVGPADLEDPAGASGSRRARRRGSRARRGWRSAGSGCGRPTSGSPSPAAPRRGARSISKRGAAGADDDRGPQLGDRHRPVGEDPPHLVAAAEVGREARPSSSPRPPR